MAQLAVTIAEQMGLGKTTIHTIHLAASIHDIGKISVPSEILTRPRELSKAEMDLMKTHPTAGYEVLKNIPFPWPIAEIVLQHHERLDGSGYPRSLKGAEIRIEARVIAVADTVDSMGSHRPYWPGLGLARANEVIRKGRGSLYDANVVDAYLSDAVQQQLNYSY